MNQNDVERQRQQALCTFLQEAVLYDFQSVDYIIYFSEKNPL